MKKRIITICTIALTAMFLAIIGCAILYTPPQNNVSIPYLVPVDNAAPIYQNATSSLLSTGSASMKITTSTQLIINQEILTEHAEQTLSYQGYNTDALTVTSDEFLTIGDHTVEISEDFSSGTAYVTIDQTSFCADFSASEYQKRLIPASFFDSTLYENIIGFDNGTESLLYFTSPTEAEAWAVKEEWNFSGAKGFALIGHENTILRCVYTATYSQGTNMLHLSVTAEHLDFDAAIMLPEDSSAYTKISYLDGPRMLEKACGYLMQADSISATYNDRIFCQAFGDERTKNISLYWIDQNDFSALVDTETLLTNTGRVGDVTRHMHRELFVDGSYTIRADENEPTENETLTAEEMHKYCKDQLVSTIMLPQHIANAEATEIENTIYITFTPNEAFSGLVSSSACQALYQKSELLNELASKNSTQMLEAYLVLDKFTGLPLSAGVEYGGLYTIEGLPYELEYSAYQSYSVANADTSVKINEAAGH